jgi:DNA modification methylase
MGFEISEIDGLFEGQAASPSRNDPADVLPDSASKPQVSRVNDLFKLERHRILCGDSRNDASYEQLMNGNRANMVFADPPYNDPIDGYVTGFGRVHHPEFVSASGEMDERDFTEFLRCALEKAAKNSSDGSLHFICMDWRHSHEVLSAARSIHSEFKNLCVWVKDTGGQGSLYRSQHELIFVFKNGKQPHRNNIQLGQFGRYRTNVWQYRRVNGISGRSEEDNLSKLHPTIKPVELVADAILDCTARREIVLDPFAGSGTTVLAAERTGRTCYGIELEPGYVDTIVRRWQAFTGQTAVLESTGVSFNELEEKKNEYGR